MYNKIRNKIICMTFFFWKINLDNDHSLGYFNLYSNYNEVLFFKEVSLSLSVRTRARACVRAILHYYKPRQLDIRDMITYFWAKVELFAFPPADASIATKIKWTL